jgi:predicted transcriptional regulator
MDSDSYFTWFCHSFVETQFPKQVKKSSRKKDCFSKRVVSSEQMLTLVAVAAFITT